MQPVWLVFRPPQVLAVSGSITHECILQVSDSSGFGSGGTSVAATVQSSSDSSCFNASAEVQPDFSFSIVPSNQIVECSPTRIWWDPSLVQGYVASCV